MKRLPSLSDISARIRRAECAAIDARDSFLATSDAKYLRAQRKSLDLASDLKMALDARMSNSGCL